MVELQPNWVRPPQVSVSLCEQSAGSRQQAFGRQSQKSAVKQKWGGEKSRGKVLGVREAFLRLHEPADKGLYLYRLVLDCAFALVVWHLQSPVEDLSVL